MENRNKEEGIYLIGLSLIEKTSNENGQSSIDCGKLWQEFTAGNYAQKIPGKLSEEILAVYYNYEGDYTKPFSYFIGCKVAAGTTVPEDMDILTIPKGSYLKLTAKGKMPDCIADKWQEIWTSDISRAYTADYEVYDHRSHNWQNAEVDIFLSIP